MSKERKEINKEKLKALEVTLGKIEKDFGKGTIMKLGDFGLSCYISECKGKVGSMNYVSPFVLLSNEPIWTTADDLYSMACVIYECLTCQPFMYDDVIDPVFDEDMKTGRLMRSDLYTLRNRLRQIQLSGLDLLEDGRRIYEKNFNEKMNELYDLINDIERQDGTKYTVLRKIYELCTRLLDPSNDNIYSVDDVRNFMY